MSFLGTAAMLAPSVLGTKQMGAPAPAFQPGQMGMNTMRDPMGVMQSQTPQGLLTPPDFAPLMGETPPVDTTGDEEEGGFDKFFSNLDSTLNSPSKALGLGLLGRINPALGVGGLLMSGFGGPQGAINAVKGIPGTIGGLLG